MKKTDKTTKRKPNVLSRDVKRSVRLLFSRWSPSTLAAFGSWLSDLASYPQRARLDADGYVDVLDQTERALVAAGVATKLANVHTFREVQ